MPLLPPPREKPSPGDESAILAYVNGFVWESLERSRAARDQAQRNFNLYLGYHWTEVAPDQSAARYVFNRIKTIIVSHAAIQAGKKPKVDILPRQSGTNGPCFVNTDVLGSLLPIIQSNPDLMALVSKIPLECMEAPPATPAPLPRQIYEELKSAIEQGQMLVEMAKMQRLPLPKVLPPELIVEVSDITAAESMQVLFDAQWDECNADYHAITDALYNTIGGWSHIFYRWDALAERHLLHNAETYQVFLDPTRPDISVSPIAVFDMGMTEEQGMAEFPRYAKVIDQTFVPGKPVLPGGQPYTPAAVYNQTNFRRKAGFIRFCYVRNQPYPMDIAEALRRGLIVEGKPYVGPNTPVQNADGATGPDVSTVGAETGGNGAGGTAGNPAPSSGTDTAFQPESSANPERGGAAGPGEPPPNAGGLANLAPEPSVFLLVVNGQPAFEVKPWDGNWPTRRGIREIVIIMNRVVDDHEYLGADIPITHNVNFPHMYGPLGQGTPEDLESLNMAVNEMLSDLVHLVRSAAFPTTVIADSLQKANPEIGLEAYRRPSTVLTAPDNLLAAFKDLMKNVEPGQVSPDLWRFLTQMLELLDRQGEMTNITQGEASPGMSGELFKSASAAAQSSVLFRARRTETMLKYLAKLMLGGISQMSVDAMARACPKYPRYIWAAFKNWYPRLSYDLKIEISAGGGATKMQRAMGLIGAAKVPVAVSQKTLQESLDLDPDKETKQRAEESMQQMAMQQGPMGMAAPPRQPQGEPDGKLNGPT